MLQLIAAGGNVYYLAKFAGIFGLDMQDIGAQQTGLTKEQFKARLVAAGVDGAAARARAYCLSEAVARPARHGPASGKVKVPTPAVAERTDASWADRSTA